MSMPYDYNLEDPRTWSPSDNVKGPYEAYVWLTKHLLKFDRLLYTVKNTRATFGFQPFTLSHGKVMGHTWIRKFTNNDPTVSKTTKTFKTRDGDTCEFITWKIPDLGLMTVFLDKDNPSMLVYLSTTVLMEREQDPNKIYDKYIQELSKTDNPDSAIYLMKRFAMTGA